MAMVVYDVYDVRRRDKTTNKKRTGEINDDDHKQDRPKNSNNLSIHPSSFCHPESQIQFHHVLVHTSARDVVVKSVVSQNDHYFRVHLLLWVQKLFLF
jgi:hypothetical protein